MKQLDQNDFILKHDTLVGKIPPGGTSTLREEGGGQSKLKSVYCVRGHLLSPCKISPKGVEAAYGSIDWNFEKRNIGDRCIPSQQILLA